MAGPVERRYDDLVRAGHEAVPAQRALARRLDALAAELAECRLKSKRSALGWIFARGRKPEPPRGLYVWGGVGTGKTMLMDLFFAAAPEPRKRRTHFHAFMAEVHERLNAHRAALKRGEARGDDPIPPVAEDIAETARLLCFDEFSVTDIADAMILGRLFERLFTEGVTIVATSNVPPDALYEGGLNRALFLPFIAILKERMEVFELAAPKDYRSEKAASDALYVTPADAAAEARLAAHFRRLSGGAAGAPAEIRVKGRRIPVPLAADGVARFSFADLCARPLSAADYLKIARAYHTIVLSGIPRLSPARRDEAKRFINLIDTLYDEGVRLVASAAAEPNDLWTGDTGTEAFEFARTASRLNEMRSPDYAPLAAPRSEDGAPGTKNGPDREIRAVQDDE